MKPVFEFDVTMTVRRRVHMSGPLTREVARDMLQKALDGGMPVELFAKRGADGKAIEVVLSNAIVIEEVQ